MLIHLNDFGIVARLRYILSSLDDGVYFASFFLMVKFDDLRLGEITRNHVRAAALRLVDTQEMCNRNCIQKLFFVFTRGCRPGGRV